MAGIIQNDPYQLLMRKIGYSVGLEKLLERVIQLADLYIQERGLTFSQFKDLSKNSFGRGDAAEHFINFYGTLNLINLIGKELYPLYGLDTISILRQYFKNDQEAFLEAVRVVLIQLILEADGDIFLNALASDFKAAKFKYLLEEMIKAKRSAIQRVIKLPSLVNRINSIVNIEKMKPKKSEKHLTKSKETSFSRFTERTEPLNSLDRTTPLFGSINTDNNINISDDYLRKVPNTRKGWAEDLGLFMKSKKTTYGISLLNTLHQELKFKHSSGCYIFWPYTSDLAKINIKPEDIIANDLSSWNVLCAIVKSKKLNINDVKGTDYESVIDILRNIYELYQQVNKGMRIIRHQLPLYIAIPCLVAVSIAKSQNIPDLPKILEKEGKRRGHRRIQKMIIRGTEGAIVFS